MEIGTKTITAECEGESSSSSGTTADNPSATATVDVVGVDKVILAGSNPENEGPLELYEGTSITLQANRRPPPKDGAWPPQNPVWEVDPINAPNGAYLKTFVPGPLIGPTLQLTGKLPNGANDTSFTVTAKCGVSTDSIQLVLKRCDAVTFDSVDKGFSKQLDFERVVNLVGPKMGSGEKITITIKVTPDTSASQQKISWQGATVVSGSNNLKATVAVDVASRQIVKILFDGHPCKEIWVWPVWVDLSVRIAGNLSPDNGSLGIQPKGLKPFGWPDPIAFGNDSIPLYMAGGTGLGPISHYTSPNFKHAIAGGRVEIVGVVKPDLVWTVCPNTTAVAMKRLVVLEKWWDNGQHCDKAEPDVDNVDEPQKIICVGSWVAGSTIVTETKDDTASPDLLDLFPGGNGKLFDLDVPACPPQFGFSIQRTAEVYVNFDQWVEFDFGVGAVKCSDVKPWSYSAQVDGDARKVIRNELKTQHIPAANMVSHFNPR